MVQWSIPTHTDTLLFVEFRVRDQLVCEFVFFLRLFFLAFFVVVDDRCCHMGTGCPVGCLWIESGYLVGSQRLLRMANLISATCGWE